MYKLYLIDILYFLYGQLYIFWYLNMLCFNISPWYKLVFPLFYTHYNWQMYYHDCTMNESHFVKILQSFMKLIFNLLFSTIAGATYSLQLWPLNTFFSLTSKYTYIFSWLINKENHTSFNIKQFLCLNHNFMNTYVKVTLLFKYSTS